MEIKVGDKVRMSKDAPEMYFFGCSYDNSVCKVILVDRDNAVITQVKNGSFAIPTKYLTKVEDEAKAKYKVGDKVRVLGHALLEGGVFTITFVEHREKRGWMYRINTHTWFPESDLAPYTEPTTPTIKVGDFVRVLENLHEPFCLDVERHLEITNVPPHAVSQKEWKVISVEMRRDCAGRIYTLKHDDSFIYNIPEDCVELVQPKEQTEDEIIRQREAEFDEFRKEELDRVLHPEKYTTYEVTIDNVAMDWDAYTANLARDIAVKIVNKNMGSDPKKVGEYSVKVAKSVVEGLKRK